MGAIRLGFIGKRLGYFGLIPYRYVKRLGTTFFLFENVINSPSEYVDDILSGEFMSYQLGDSLFKGIQARGGDDEFCKFILEKFPGTSVAYSFIRQSPKGQVEPNFIHTDEMMGDLTAILYLNKEAPSGDGTIIYDDSDKPVCSIHSKFNSAVVFDSSLRHSRSIYDNFGSVGKSRLIQVIFLRYE